jgi:hypothetical protein
LRRYYKYPERLSENIPLFRGNSRKRSQGEEIPEHSEWWRKYHAECMEGDE